MMDKQLTEVTMRVFLTGASGFVGKNLLNILDSNYQIFGLYRKHINNLPQNVIPVNGSLFNLHNAYKIKQIDVVIHIAGLTKALHSNKFYMVNSRGTKEVVNFARKKNVKHFIYISSLAAAGPNENPVPKTEKDIPLPVSNYGMSKLLGELYVKNSNLPYTIIRPPAIFGPEDVDILTYFKMVKKGIVFTSGDRSKLYSLIYVKDLVEFIKHTILKEKAMNEIFFISNHKFYTILDIISAIETALSKKSLKINLPEFTLNLISYPLQTIYALTKLPPLINLDKIKEIKQKNWICSGKKAYEHLNFLPKNSFENAIKETAQWYLEKNWL